MVSRVQFMSPIKSGGQNRPKYRPKYIGQNIVHIGQNGRSHERRRTHESNRSFEQSSLVRVHRTKVVLCTISFQLRWVFPTKSISFQNQMVVLTDFGFSNFKRLFPTKINFPT